MWTRKGHLLGDGEAAGPFENQRLLPESGGPGVSAMQPHLPSCSGRAEPARPPLWGAGSDPTEEGVSAAHPRGGDWVQNCRPAPPMVGRFLAPSPTGTWVLPPRLRLPSPEFCAYPHSLHPRFTQRGSFWPGWGSSRHSQRARRGTQVRSWKWPEPPQRSEQARPAGPPGSAGGMGVSPLPCSFPAAREKWARRFLGFCIRPRPSP